MLEHALGRLDLLVVQDGFETPTTALADVVLPAAIWGEKDGTYTNSERRVSRVRAAVAPPGEARTDFDIFLAVAERWGCARRAVRRLDRRRDDAFDEWRRVSAGRPCDYSGITWDRIDDAGGVQWPCPADDDDVPLGGTARLYGDRRFNRPDGRAAVLRGRARALRDAPRPEFPLLLNTGRTVEHWHTRTKTGRIAILEGLAPEAWVEVHPVDAAALGLRSGDLVRVASSRGAVERHPGPGHRHRPSRRGVHPVPLGRALRQPPDRRPVRPDQPRAQLQAVRGAGRAATDPGRPLVVRRLTRPDRRRVGTTSTGGHRPRSPTRSDAACPARRRSPPRRAPIRGARATCRPRGRR